MNSGAEQSKESDILILNAANEEFLPNKVVHYLKEEDRSYYALHLVTHGKGKLIYNGKEYNLKKGDMFLVSPQSEMTYYAINQWSYYWVNVGGKKVNELLSAVGFGEFFICKGVSDNEIERAFRQMTGAVQSADDLSAVGWFLVMLGRLRNLGVRKFEGQRMSERHIDAAIQYILYNYYYPDFSLDSLAGNLAISKNYLCKIFRDHTGKTPFEYLIEVRLESARKRLEESDESVHEIAKIIGYRDPLYFSKEFKRKYGVSPLQYRKNHTSQPTE